MNTDCRAHLELAPARVEVEELPGGCFILRSPIKLTPYVGNICCYLTHWAEQAPERTFLAERDQAGNWRRVSYSEALHNVRAIAQALLDRGVSVDRPVMILSDNSIESGLLQLGAMYVGLPVTPTSPAYSLISKDFNKLKYVFSMIRPGLIFADNGERFRTGIAALDLTDVALVAKQTPPRGIDASIFTELTNTTVTTAVDTAYSAVGPETAAKILFTFC